MPGFSENTDDGVGRGVIWHLLSTHYVPGTNLSNRYTLSHLMLISALQGKHDFPSLEVKMMTPLGNLSKT